MKRVNCYSPEKNGSSEETEVELSLGNGSKTTVMIVVAGEAVVQYVTKVESGALIVSYMGITQRSVVNPGVTEIKSKKLI